VFVSDGLPHRYAVRRLNPVQGVVQVVAIDGARALSHDGRLWEIQVLAERPDHTWGSLNTAGSSRQFFRFGSWHPEQGISRVPANPLLDLGAMQAASQRLIAAIRDGLALLPFPLEDRYECWLLDPHQQPLALLASTTDNTLLPELRPGPWVATLPGETGFVAPCLDERRIPNHDGQKPRRHAHELEDLVRMRAARGGRWYYRGHDGGRRPCDPAGPADTGCDFPELGLCEDWPEAWQCELVQAYLNWLSPALLTWDNIDAERRSRLELAACARPTQLDSAYPLYPEVINLARLEQARVEARLRRSAAG
jgi:hypothetical protein